MDAGPLAKYTGQLVTKLKVTLVTPQLSPPRRPQALSTPRTRGTHSSTGAWSPASFRGHHPHKPWSYAKPVLNSKHLIARPTSEGLLR